ncbi:tetratricopeptide repeat protein [Pseudomonas sp. 5P_3.1_Bac2]|uniref:tetratricopeptide repeat protein n=1 Tax=Pseudomonas sp. 5P_3.1_Bac2 TaxID=2971617 RepID=UPI0021C97A88|nr:tetratricopeptide repeat protein [Pseudomonas sp. 5P_3.1_Bac2]MCU1715720.1 sel1 repeat family protein [Pseudomonas sp. 5P_3.1_Bac2]
MRLIHSLTLPILLSGAVLLSACSSNPEHPATEPTATANAEQTQTQQNIPPALLQQAQQGDLDSQFQLGSLYFSGKPQKDLKQAEYWWKQAADKGHSMAAVSLAYLYTGRDNPELSNSVLMLKYLNQSASAGNPMAQHILGTLYLRGEQGVPQDSAQARRLFQSACQQNYPASCKALGDQPQ